MDLKYDIDRSLGEILKRGENLSRKKHRRSACIFGTLSGVTLAIMAVVFYSAADFSGFGWKSEGLPMPDLAAPCTGAVFLCS